MPLRIPTSFDDLRQMLMDNAMVIIAFIGGVAAAPTVSMLLDRIRGD